MKVRLPDRQPRRATRDQQTSQPIEGAVASKLGTFGGVFTPSVLTILGLVLFLRLGYVTGNVGLARMLLILAMATAVAVLTSVSLAAIATNLRVSGGGVYFLISRTLGPAFGGAIGLVLYLAMSVSVAFYAIGLGEAVASAIGSDASNMPRLIAAGTIVALLGLGWLGADIATRLQYLVMALLVVAIVAYFVGIATDLSFEQLSANVGRPDHGDSFWVSFAIFFPAITGFTQGVAMSGDLRTPSRSITVGTFSAIALAVVVYTMVIITMTMAVPLSDLRADNDIMRRLAPSPILIDMGVIAATLSSAIASILGAPRTLQRLAADRLLKPLEPFGVGSGPSDNPRRALVLSTGIALGTVAVGDLELVAPIISMFFLASYGMINYATYSEGRAASTSFRPTFKWFDWRLSLLGTLACLGAILAIDPVAGGLAAAAVFALYRYLQRSIHQVRWADSTRGFHAAEVRTHLLGMTAQGEGKDWRPCTVAFAPRDPTRRQRLTSVVSWLEGGAGFTTVVRVIESRGPVARKHAARVNLELRRELDSRDHKLYGRVIVATDLEAGVSAMLQAHGMGALLPNLAAFSWYEYQDVSQGLSGDYETMAQTAVRFGCNVAVVHASDQAWERVPAEPRSPSTIAVWWSDDRSGQLLTLLAWMCTRDSVWSGAQVTVWVACDSGPDEQHRIATLLEDARIPARVAGAAGSHQFVASVQAADMVFAPFRIHKGLSLGPADLPIDDLVGRLPLVVFAHVAAEVQLDMQPDEGHHAALAEARDRATEAGARAETLDKEASRLIVAAEMLRLEFGVNGSEAAPDSPLAVSLQAASQAQRRYLDARARADEAWRLVSEIDPDASDSSVNPQLWLGTNARSRNGAGTLQ